MGLNTKMDSLINLLNGVSVSEKTFEESLDSIIDKMETTDVHDPEYEIERLFLNNRKLKYINHLIKKHKPDHPKFFKCLDLFLEEIDKKTQCYLKQFDWYNNTEFDETIQEEILEMKEYFEDSLNQNDTTKKLKIIIKAYRILVSIVDELRVTIPFVDIEIEFKEQFKKRKRESESEL